MARKLTCQEHDPCAAEDRMWERLRLGRARWVDLLEQHLGSTRARELAGEKDGVVFRKEDDPSLAVATGWSGKILFDLPKWFQDAGQDPKSRMEELGRLYFRFYRELCEHARDSAMVKFLDALKADINASARSPRGRYAKLPPKDRRQAIWRDKIKPLLAARLLGELGWDDLPDSAALAAWRLRARKSRPPDRVGYWRLVRGVIETISHEEHSWKVRARKKSGWVRDLITEQGFNLDDEWTRFWDDCLEKELEVAGRQEERGEEI